MDSLPISLEPRPFQALLNGLIRKTFYQEPDITIEYLAGELYADSELEAAQIVNEISLYEKVSVCSRGQSAISFTAAAPRRQMARFPAFTFYSLSHCPSQTMPHTADLAQGGAAELGSRGDDGIPQRAFAAC
jgi:hypothetical protein